MTFRTGVAVRAHPHIFSSSFPVITFSCLFSDHVVLFPNFIELVAGAQRVAGGKGRAFSASLLFFKIHTNRSVCQVIYSS